MPPVMPILQAGRRRASVSAWLGARVIALVVIAVSFSTPLVRAESSDDVELRIKAAFLYNFARFVEWPHSSQDSSQAPIIIAVLGRDPLLPVLESTVKGKSVNGHPLQVREFIAPGQVDCQILYVARSEEKRIKADLELVAGRPILIVSDSKSSLQHGVMIAFREVHESVRFEINREAAEHAGLKLSSQLLKVAIGGAEPGQ
jgi:hypothetical protein